MPQLYNLARMTTATTGTGTLTLGSAVPGFLTFAQAGIQDQDLITYCIGDGNNREIGRGVYTATGTTLTRGALNSTNSNNPISLSGNAQVVITAAAQDIQTPSPPQGRITFATGAPVMNTVNLTMPVTSTIAYYTSYSGYNVPIFNGSKWSMETFASDLQNLNSDATYNPAATVASSIYDLFIWMKSGVMTLSRGPVWSSTILRAMSLQRINGILTNASAITNGPAANQGTYVGSIMTNSANNFVYDTGSSATGGGRAWLGLWNMYNRIRAQCVVSDSGGSYTYASNSWRVMRNAPGTYFIYLLCGQVEDVTDCNIWTESTSGGTSGQTMYAGIGLDSTTGNSLGAMDIAQCPVASTVAFSQQAFWKGLIGNGAHTLYPLENAGGVTATLNAAGANYFSAQHMC